MVEVSRAAIVTSLANAEETLAAGRLRGLPMPYGVYAGTVGPVQLYVRRADEVAAWGIVLDAELEHGFTGDQVVTSAEGDLSGVRVRVACAEPAAK